MRTGIGSNRTLNGSKPIKNDVWANKLHGWRTIETRESVKLFFLRRLLRLMDYFAVLTHKPSGLPLNDNSSKLVRTNGKSQFCTPKEFASPLWKGDFDE
jgi:hypothetical protein